MDIDQRALDLARHLLEVETKSKIRGNKRSPSDIDKFINVLSGYKKELCLIMLHLQMHKQD